MASPLSCISLGSNEEEIRWRENENGILSFLLVVPRERERMEEEKKENGDRFLGKREPAKTREKWGFYTSFS